MFRQATSFAHVVLLLSLTACGGGSTPAPDAGGDAGPRRCTADLDCSDALFCDGIERCAPSAAGADAHGCVAPAAPACAAPMTCSESAATCVAPCGAIPDADGDGHVSLSCGGDDCDDADANRYPGHAEICDAVGHDEDCTASTYGPDGDGDGSPATTCCNLQPAGTLACGTDCDDARATVNATAVESCNGSDDNCNGTIDEGVLSTFYPDCDGDGFGIASASAVMACAAPVAAPPVCGGVGGWAAVAGDCDDAVGGRNPGNPEVCDLIADNDCNTTTFTFDTDHDGHDASSCGGDDCRDDDVAVHPGAPELCDRKDDVCAFGGGTAVAEDADADGYAPTGAACTGGPLPKLDCNDASMGVHPGATEICDGVDDDCNGMSDEDPAAMTSCNHTGTVGACVLGGCTISSCTGTYRNCDGVATNGCEANLASDPMNCTACGTRCATGALCTSTGCMCPAAIPTLCPGACVDTTTDVANCGMCGNPCPSGATCSGSTCRCPFGWILCGSACVDPMSDTANCGGCGRACTGGSCAGGSCTCPGAMGMLCSGVCHDLSVDLANCGGCGAGCIAGSCAGGTCTCPPTAPTICSGTCTNTITDPANCAACMRNCGAAGVCATSTCDGISRIWPSSYAGRTGGGLALWSPVDRMVPYTIPAMVATATPYTAVAEVASGSSFCVLHTDHRLVCSGLPDVAGVVDVAGGAFHMCFVAGDGRVYCWGFNMHGGLGDGTRLARSSPVAVVGITTARRVRVGNEHSCALLADGTVSCWGANGVGQVTPGGSTADVLTPVAVASIAGATTIATSNGTSYALRADGSIACWGDVSEGNCGNPAATSYPTTVAGLSGMVGISSTFADACAWDAAGAAYCWGRDTANELLDGGASSWVGSPVRLTGLPPAREVVDAGGDMLLLGLDGTVWCWGVQYGAPPVRVLALTPPP